MTAPPIESPAPPPAGDAPAGGPLGSPRAGAALVAGLVLLLCLPFVQKAFHIDDVAFLNLSKMIGWNPLHATPVDYDYGGGVIRGLLPYEITHPLLVPYCIKLVSAIAGESETALHLAFLVFPLLAAVALLRLHAVLFAEPRGTAVAVGVAFCTLPAFLVNAQNVMTDVPAVAFVLLGVSETLGGLGRGPRWRTWLGSAALALAVFTAYQAVVFVPLLLLFALWRRQLTVERALALVLPLLLLFAWLGAVYSAHDVFPLLKSRIEGSQASVGEEIRKGMNLRLMLQRGVSVLAFLGASTLFVLPLHHALRRSLLRFFLPAFAILTAAGYVATQPLTRYPFPSQLALGAFVALGVMTFVALGGTLWRRAREREAAGTAAFLLVWVGGVATYCVVFLPFSAARYLLPAYPAVLLLLLSDPAWTLTTRPRRVAVAAVLAASALFGLVSAYSDYRFASTYREFAATLAEMKEAGGRDRAVWYVGEWGMRYYMDSAGARYLHADSTEPARGDLVVIPEMPRFWAPSPELRSRMRPVGRKTYASPLPLRLFNARSRAGFYAQFIGMLPFAFSAEPDEVFQVYEVFR